MSCKDKKKNKCNRKILPKIAITTAKFCRKLRLQPQNSAENCDYNRKILPKIAITTVATGDTKAFGDTVRKDFLRLSDGQHGGHAHKARR